ncbi:hypothetical protein SAMN05444166_4335 [Singulisphaera sp. GP187]|nr:hypothetical protein SAMN05444166_4335 [Singulisphaera sp. GP187]
MCTEVGSETRGRFDPSLNRSERISPPDSHDPGKRHADSRHWSESLLFCNDPSAQENSPPQAECRPQADSDWTSISLARAGLPTQSPTTLKVQNCRCLTPEALARNQTEPRKRPSRHRAEIHHGKTVAVPFKTASDQQARSVASQRAATSAAEIQAPSHEKPTLCAALPSSRTAIARKHLDDKCLMSDRVSALQQLFSSCFLKRQIKIKPEHFGDRSTL